MHLYKQNIFLGLYIDDHNFLNYVSNLKNYLLSQGIDPKLFIPMDKLHISIVKLDLHKNILNKKTFEKVQNVIDSITRKYINIRLFPNKLFYGARSKSIKIYFDDKSKNFIVEKIRKLIIQNCDSLEGIDFNDKESFVPHVTLLSSFKLKSLQENQISCVIDSINKFSNIEIPDFNIKSVSMLLPTEDSQRNLKEQQIIEETKKLSVNLYKISLLFFITLLPM